MILALKDKQIIFSFRYFLRTLLMRMNLEDIYQERELVLVVIKVGLILLEIKLGLIFVGIKLGLAS